MNNLIVSLAGMIRAMKAATPAVERRAASRPFGKKESAPRAKQPPERKGAPGDAEVWQEF